MPDSRRLLILGGTGEARQLADSLAGRDGLTVITSLAGRTVAPLRPAGELRIGGFGGAEGLAGYLRSAKIDLVIDATHPYAAAISRHAVAAAEATGRPLLRLERTAWQAEAGDHWIEVDSLARRPRAAPSLGRRAFLTIGIKELAAFAECRTSGSWCGWSQHRKSPRPCSPTASSLVAVPSATEAERELLREHRIDLIIAKNSGGTATHGKIVAARELGLPVMLLRRPPLPPAETAGSIEAAVGWVGKMLG